MIIEKALEILRKIDKAVEFKDDDRLAIQLNELQNELDSIQGKYEETEEILRKAWKRIG